MLIERQLENDFIAELKSMPVLSAAQVVGSREVAAAGDTKSEEDTKATIVAVACGFRQNDAFSLTPITMSMSITVMTRAELDPTSEGHDTVIEAIADLLSRWHKDGNAMSEALTNQKFLAGELRMDGGTARTYDQMTQTWSETISFSIRGAERFLPADYYTMLVFNDGTTTTLSTILDNDTFIALGYKSDMYTWIKQPTQLSVGSQNTEIPSYMFDNCWYLENVTIPNSITTIGNDAFSGCSVLTSVTIPENVVEIQNDAFYRSESISDVYCYANPNNLTWEDDESDDFITTPPKATMCHVKFKYLSAFNQNFSDVNVTFVGDIDMPPETNVTYANGETAQFNITGYLMRNKIQNIGSVAEVTIGTNVTAIGDPTTQFADSTFRGCTSLVNVVIPSTVKSIGGYSFDGCTSLTHITIPKSVTSIQIAAFVRCAALMNVKFEGRTMAQVQAMYFYNWNLPSGCVIHCTDGDITIGSETVVQYTDGRTVKLSIQGEIDRYSIPDKAYVSELDIGNTVTSIGNYAFAACSSLTSVTIPDSVSSICDYGFSRCSSLSSVTIPDSATSIGYGAFFNCSSLISVTIPDSVTRIVDYAFHGCSGLTSATIGNGVSSIGDWAFYNCRGLTNVTIGDSLVSIGDLAFFSCIGLTSVEFEGNAPTVGEQAFIGVASGCKALISPTATGFPAAGETWNGLVVEVKS